VGKHDAVFTLTDPKGNVLFKHRKPTSEYGITSAECELAGEIQEGQYLVACQVGDTRTQMAVEVKRYVLPKFTVEVKPDRPFYEPGDDRNPTTATIVVQADYVFGKPVTKAKVELKVIGDAAGQQVLKTLEGETDDSGKAELKYQLPRNLVGTRRD